MADFVELNSDRLFLRKLNKSDAECMLHYFSQEKVMQYYDLEAFTNIDQAINLIDLWNKRFDEDKGVRWAITLKDNPNNLIGTCGFHSISKENNRAEIGYEISPEHWGKGIATEAIKAILGHGFKVLNYHRIEAFIAPENIASEKVLTKNGMEAEGILRDYFFEKGKFVSAKIFSIIK